MSVRAAATRGYRDSNERYEILAPVPGRPARMRHRFLARVIDGAILLAVSFVLFIGLVSVPQTDVNCVAGYGGPCLTRHALVSGSTVALWLLGMLLYEVLLVAFVGGTLGKLLMGIRVVDQHTGRFIGFVRSVVRVVVLVVTGFFFCYLGFLSPFWDNSGRRQGFADRWARDVVIRAA